MVVTLWIYETRISWTSLNLDLKYHFHKSRSSTAETAGTQSLMTFSKVWPSLHECPVHSCLFNVVMCRSSVPNIPYIRTETWKLWVEFTLMFQEMCDFYFAYCRETQTFFTWMRLDDFDVLLHCRKFVDVVRFILTKNSKWYQRNTPLRIIAYKIRNFMEICAVRY